MSEINLPPLFVGQTVVAIKDGKDSNNLVVYKVGQKFIVNGLMHHPCDGWLVDVGIVVRSGNGTKCKECLLKLNSDFIWWCYSKHFAPIEENFQSISLEKVMEKETHLISVN